MQRILQAPVTTALTGITLMIFGLYDLYEELLSPSHVHTFILIAILLMLSALQHVHEGLHKILGFAKNTSVTSILENCNNFFERRSIRITMSLIVLASAIYGIITNIDQMYYRSIPLCSGVIMLIIPLSGGYNSTKELIGNR